MFPTQAWGGLIFGPAARTQFENFQAVAGDTFIDFESVATGTNLTTQFSGITFASNISTTGIPFGPVHVEVSGAFSGTDGNTIVGSPCDPGCVDDGRVGYEIVFATPQRRAGLERIWNTSTKTQFYNASDTLLAEHVNTVGTEFVGFIADGTVPATDWVSRIQIDGNLLTGVRQVGYSNDLFYGTAISAFTVDSTADVVDAVPGNGVCSTAGGACTLRAAVQESNALAGDDTITRPAGTYTLTNTGSGENAAATGDLDVSQTLTVNGAGEGSTIIDGNDTDRIFHVTSSSATLELTDMTLQNGNAGGSDGGAISTSSGTVVLSDCTITGGNAGSGGALGNSSGDWTLTNVTLSGNNADGGLSGGAINSSSGSWTFDNCTISGNTIDTGPGGAINTSSGTWTFTDSTISGNMAPDGAGGAINTSSGSWTFTNTTISGNMSESDGGAINTSSGTWTFTDSTISGNSVTDATASGGGLRSSGGGTWTFDGCTFSGNSAGTDMSSADGGGVDIGGGTWTFKNSTFSSNSAGSEGGGVAVFDGDAIFNNCTFSSNSAYEGGALYQGENATITLENTIVANSPSGGDCDGVITSSGYNLDSDGSCGLSSTGDLSSMDPKLGALADNGGNTLTHALLTGSPAIDAGNGATCEATDQRGESRPMDGDGDTIAVCDMGAFELQAAAGMTGDGNGDGVLNAADLSACAALLGTSNAVCDADSSGTVDQADIIAIVTLIFSP